MIQRTKALRQVAQTAPYFRNGQAATLDEVIAFYDRGGDPAGTILNHASPSASVALPL